ncbi:MAG: glycosyltransferase [Paenibacillus lautus]|jgi:glycosyltransferase involved in cell wall biosynthesis|uniref:glycosyltransferase family 2 protein n=1 Tax=Paenibacillus lautus TaxID=1401 RepID=UPI0026ED325D|nr:glycosyltransferase family 2 protein [Paenibacillus lautus]MCI1773929.1 glycosyltransferase [Paenibacillus lautus]
MTIQISVCICTRNRPDDLAKAIESIQKSSFPVYEIIVSDDSTDSKTEDLLRHHFRDVIYVQGPRKGLCANRNNALTKARGTHVMFMDDDVIMRIDFIETIVAKLNHAMEGEHKLIIVTGIENKNGSQVYPHDQSFLGYQRKPYKNENLMTVVINSTVFPMTLFNIIKFDEHLIYGYDEVDLTTRAIKCGYKIILCEEASNNHYPSNQNRDYYLPVQEASRIYVTFKRYCKTENSTIKAYLFFLIASCHVVVSKLKSNGLAGFKDAFNTLKISHRYIQNMSQY